MEEHHEQHVMNEKRKRLTQSELAIINNTKEVVQLVAHGPTTAAVRFLEGPYRGKEMVLLLEDLSPYSIPTGDVPCLNEALEELTRDATFKEYGLMTVNRKSLERVLVKYFTKIMLNERSGFENTTTEIAEYPEKNQVHVLLPREARRERESIDV